MLVPVQSSRRIAALALLLALITINSPAAAQTNSRRAAGARAIKSVPAPRQTLGFTPGEDRKLASWSQFVDYFQALDRASDRVQLHELGKTTLGRPFLLAIISSPQNLAKLDRYRDIQRRLADPRLLTGGDEEAARLIAEGRAVVLITCGIHSTEVGANLVSLNIAHRLASDNSAETREILDKTIILLVPSLNPDGVDIVKNWYDKTLGTKYEGSGPPELYHHYVGHDNNRDWYAFTQVETQMTVDRVHNVWHPQIVHDIHQQGATGVRFFLPPYIEPWEPNVPPLIQAGVNFMGSMIAWEMTAAGKAGVSINSIYDAFTPARAYQHYHGGIRILSETASARLASPINMPFERLGPQPNVDPKVRSWNHPLPWRGGEWRLADIVDYQEAGAFALLRNAARYREYWLENFYRIGKEAVRERRAGEPHAFLLSPPPANDPARLWKEHGLARLEAILERGQVEVLKAEEEFTAGGRRYPAGTRIVPLRQPYGAFAKTLLERQRYPDLREYPGGPPKRPYDVTAHTLPLLMGVDVAQIDEPLPAVRTSANRPGAALGWAAAEGGRMPRVALYKSWTGSMDEGWTRWIFDQHKLEYTSLLDAEARAGNLRAKYDCIILPDMSASLLVNGLPAAAYPEEVAGGLSEAGVRALREFVEAGGTLITFNRASLFAITHLGAPVRNVLEGVGERDFYCPGSILKIAFDAGEALAEGAPGLEGRTGEAAVWAERGPAFEVTGGDARVVARFAGADELLLSGWLLGGDRIAGKGAIVEAKRGRGRIVMFAMRPQYRGQSVATLPFLFNAIRTSAQ